MVEMIGIEPIHPLRERGYSPLRLSKLRRTSVRINIGWSVRLDSNQRPRASKARTLTKLSYAQRSWVAGKMEFSW